MRIEIEKKSFLVVDDYGDMRGVIRNMLASFGVSQIGSAANGKEAILEMEENRYDVILCDYNLGAGKDGQQVLEEARQRDLIGVGVIFLMITAENAREMVMGAVEYEPDSYLTKPFTKDLLRQRIDRLLAKKADLLAVEKALNYKEYERAIQLLDKKIAGKPRNMGELIKLKADCCLKSGAFDKAIEIYESVLAEREMPWARLGLGKTYFSSGRYAEARQVFEKLIEENERFMAAYDWLAKTFQMLDESADAEEVLKKAIGFSPKAILRQRALGELALRKGDTKVAEKAFSHAVKLGRHSVYKHPSLYANLARVKTSNHSGDEGLKVLRDLSKAFGSDKEAELYSAMTETLIQKELGNDEKAAASLAKAESLYGDMGERAAPELAMGMARACSSQGDKERANELLHQAVRNNHAEDAFLKEVGAAFEELGLENDPKALIAEIRKEIVQINNKGVQLAKSGSLSEAVGLFEEAAEGMSGNKVVNLNAARVYIMQMQEQGVDPTSLGKAREYLERVKRLDPENPTLRKVQRMYYQLTSAS